ncbi:Alpha/beta hydrolase family protein [Bremerella volcania]|uniref:Alpha/beta hydrolase family protein n=1 Tax=Bremerella volcania TaxID=2527984 RepID=A0A518C8J9_9BACT|nr:alpha/beta fold hydrolase [Bremerella volcania]QDU75558.1 Alpha/beta hydrolase family protein [Bremerella volcania]
MESDNQQDADHAERVILIHGLSGNRWVLGPLNRFLAQNQYLPTRWCYRSVGNSVTNHAQRLRAFLKGEADSLEPLHFVTHSMGGIILRAVLADMHWRRPGRLVMLAPPNHGSRVAALAARGLHYLCPALSDISTSPDSLVHRLPMVDSLDTGVIAGTQDILVHLESTYIENQVDHVLVPCGHNRILRHPESLREILHFLRTGRFSEGACRTAPAASPRGVMV